MNPRTTDRPEDPNRLTLTQADFDTIREIVRTGTETALVPLTKRVGALELRMTELSDEVAGLSRRVDERSDEIERLTRSSRKHAVLIAEHMGLLRQRRPTGPGP